MIAEMELLELLLKQAEKADMAGVHSASDALWMAHQKIVRLEAELEACRAQQGAALP